MCEFSFKKSIFQSVVHCNQTTSVLLTIMLKLRAGNPRAASSIGISTAIGWQLIDDNGDVSHALVSVKHCWTSFLYRTKLPIAGAEILECLITEAWHLNQPLIFSWTWPTALQNFSTHHFQSEPIAGKSSTKAGEIVHFIASPGIIGYVFSPVISRSSSLLHD